MAYKDYSQYINVQPNNAGMRVGGDSDGNIVITREEDTGVKSVAYSGNTLTITDQNDSEYTATITSGGNAAIDSEGYGINITTEDDKVIISVDTDVIADTEWTKEYFTGAFADEFTYVLLDSDQATYENNSGVGVGQAYLVQNSNGHTLIFVHEPHREQLHRRFIKVTDTGTNNYSIYPVKYTNDFDGGNAVEFVCGTAIYNSAGTEVNENANTFIIEHDSDGSGGSSFSIGYGLDHDSDNRIEVDTDVIADTEWVKDYTAEHNHNVSHGYQRYFPDSEYVVRRASSSISGTNVVAFNDDGEMVWFRSNNPDVYDTDVGVGETLRVEYRDGSDPFSSPEIGYYDVILFEYNDLDEIYTMGLTHIQGADPVNDRANAYDSDGQYRIYLADMAITDVPFDGSHSGYVVAPSSGARNTSHFLDGTGGFTAFDSDRFIAGENITIEDSDSKVKISADGGGGFNADTDRIAIGNNAAADSDHAIAIGVGAIARGENTIVLGQGVKAHVDGRTLTFNIDGLSPEDPGTISYASAQIDGVNASATNSFTFANGSVIDIDNAGDNIEIVLTQAWTIDDTEGNFTGQGVSSFLLGNASTNLVNEATYKYAVAINADAEADSELVIGKVNTIRTPDFTGGSNQYITVDADGVWTTETVSASIDSDNFIAGANITIEDSDSKVKISATVDGGADNILVRNRQDDGDTAYIDVLLTSGGSQIGSVERIVTEGFGTVIESGATHTMSVDTEVIADTDWVKDNFGGGHSSIYVEADNGDTSPLVYIKHNSDDTVDVHTIDSEYAGSGSGEVQSGYYDAGGRITIEVGDTDASVPFDTDGTDVYIVTDTYTAIISGKPDNVGNDPADNLTFMEWDSATIVSGATTDYRVKAFGNHTLSSVHTGKLGFTMADTDWIKTNTQTHISGGDGINIISDTEIEVDDGFGLNFDSNRELQVDTSQIATTEYVQSAVRNATRGEIGEKTDEHTLYLADTEHDQLRFLQDAGVTNNRSFIVNTRGDTVYQGIAANDDDLRVVQTTDGGTETVNANASRNWEAVQYGVYEGNKWDESDAFTYNSQAFKYNGDAPTRVWNSQESTFSNVAFFRNGHNSSSTYQVTARVQLIVVDSLDQVRLHDGPQLVAQSDEFEIDLTNGQTQVTESPVRLAAVDSDHGTTINPGQYLAVRWACHIDHYDDTGVSLTDAPYLVWSGTSGTQTHHAGRADVRTLTYELYLDPADGTLKYGNNTRTPELINTIIDTDGYITNDAQPFFKVHGNTGNPASVTNNTGAIAIGEGATVNSHNDAIALGRGASVDKFHQMRIAGINEILMDNTYDADTDHALVTHNQLNNHGVDASEFVAVGCNITDTDNNRVKITATTVANGFGITTETNANLDYVTDISVDTEVIAERSWVTDNFEPINSFSPTTPANSQRAARKLFREIAELESGDYTRLEWDTDNGGYQLWYDTEYTDSVDATHYVEIDKGTPGQFQWRLYTGGDNSGTHLATKRKFTATDTVGAVFDYIEPI